MPVPGTPLSLIRSFGYAVKGDVNILCFVCRFIGIAGIRHGFAIGGIGAFQLVQDTVLDFLPSWSAPTAVSYRRI